MKGMTGLMEHGLQIALEAHRVHEDERQAGLAQRVLVATRGLAFAVVQIEQALFPHPTESGRQLRVHAIENTLNTGFHFR